MTECSVDSVRVAYPLFHAGGGGSTPTSTLQLQFDEIPRDVMEDLNRKWHSRLPVFRTATPCRVYYGAEHGGVWYAVAAWSHPIARLLPMNWLELRRLAIAADAPRNTASRMLGWMARDIRRRFVDVVRLLSYQDTEVHQGTIYRAAGWDRVPIRGSCNDWKHRSSRFRNPPQTTAVKVRWELALKDACPIGASV